MPKGTSRPGKNKGDPLMQGVDRRVRARAQGRESSGRNAGKTTDPYSNYMAREALGIGSRFATPKAPVKTSASPVNLSPIAGSGRKRPGGVAPKNSGRRRPGS